MLFRPLIGRLCDVKWIHACYLFQIAAAVDGLATVILPLARKNVHFVFYFLLYGAADGAVGCAMFVAVMFCFKGVKRVHGFGLYQSITNGVAAFGPALGGMSFEALLHHAVSSCGPHPLPTPHLSAVC